jgi:hypothetical protein
MFEHTALVKMRSFEMHEILQYLKHNGERLDSEIAAGTGIPLAKVRLGVADLLARGDVIMCRVTRFKGGEKIDGMLYRSAGYIPRASPGRKPKPRAQV